MNYYHTRGQPLEKQIASLLGPVAFLKRKQQELPQPNHEGNREDSAAAAEEEAAKKLRKTVMHLLRIIVQIWQPGSSQSNRNSVGVPT